MTKWISVKDRLPEPDTIVLVWFKGYGESWVRFGEINSNHWRPEGGNGNFDARISHWMPMPEAPESQ